MLALSFNLFFINIFFQPYFNKTDSQITGSALPHLKRRMRRLYMEKSVKRFPCPAFFLSFICENIFVQFVKIWWHFSRFIFSVWIRPFLIIWICCVLLLINKYAMNRKICTATGLGVMSTKKIADLRKSRTIWQNHGKIRQSKQKMYTHLRSRLQGIFSCISHAVKLA